MGDLLATFVTVGRDQPQTPEPDSLNEVQSAESAHLSLRVEGMYPLLDLITEQSSSGLGNPVFSCYTYAHNILVDKIVIAQQSLQEFINTLSPGAYSSITKVNFKILDNVVLKPFGIYGSKEEIVRFLCEIKAIDGNTYVFASFSYLGRLTPRRQRAGIARATEWTCGREF